MTQTTLTTMFQCNDAPVKFYDANEPFGELSNFHITADPILFKGKRYKTSEHLYQALKFLHDKSTKADERYADLIRTAKTPNMAKILARMKPGGKYAWHVPLDAHINYALARGVQPRPDWDLVKLSRMEMVLMHKFTQISKSARILVSTGVRPLVEHTPRDHFWGDGGDGSGRNHLGRLLEKVRDNLSRRNKKRARQRSLAV